jgi:outer membrane protein assembly factor BamA
MPFCGSDWRTARRRLEQVGLFASAGEPRVELRPAGGVRVVLPVEETKHNRVEGAVGYSGRTRAVTGLVDLQLGNFLGTGRRFAVRWERQQKDQSRLRLEARDPLLRPLPVGARLSLEQEVRDSTYTTAVLELLGEASLARDFTALAGAEWRRSVLGHEPAERHRRVSSVFGGRWDTRRPGAWSGGRLETTYRSGRTRVRPAGGGPEASLRLDRAEVLTERFVGQGAFVVRMGLVAAAVSQADSLPPSEALRFGGTANLRGFADESFAARRYATGQLELGPAWPEARAYVFLDAAAWRPPGRAERDRDTLGFGIGLAQESAGRRVVIDVGVPRGGNIADGRVHAQVERRF